MRTALAALKPALTAAEAEYVGRAQQGIGRCGLNPWVPGAPVKVQLYFPLAHEPIYREAASTLHWVRRPVGWRCGCGSSRKRMPRVRARSRNPSSPRSPLSGLTLMARCHP